MARIPKKIIKDIAIVVIGVLAIWGGLLVVFGTSNPFYVVASGSMIPVLQVYDVLVVQGHVDFDDIVVGDIIVFNGPSDHERVIVHRVESIINDDPRTIRTKGDANTASIPGTDFPITKDDYIGKVIYTIPEVGYVTQLIQPPINYIIIAIVIGVTILKQIMNKKDDNSKKSDSDSGPKDNSGPDINDLEMDSAYTERKENSDVLEDIEKSIDTIDDQTSQK